LSSCFPAEILGPPVWQQTAATDQHFKSFSMTSVTSAAQNTSLKTPTKPVPMSIRKIKKKLSNLKTFLGQRDSTYNVAQIAKIFKTQKPS
jgi:hypothetical protein